MNLILLLFLTLLPGAKSNVPDPQDCSSIEITYSTKTIGGQVTIDIQAKGGTSPYYYFFFDEKNNPLSWDFKKSNFIVENSKYPKYIKVRDAEGCVKTIEFNESANN